ncbi:MAG TPA: pyridoxamine 5'-phosphate oxidase family protein [Desulfitobacterium dehalogenans]|uniref:Pyridoxamine 5'-phosphate oxidase family protein n=1 Tax=Desulfitobacterium dehalogenans TaxID=36854 RepID=A0A7C7DC72_9FIRM|nr:pyridoxamine 5'-phosphate oxidase family protein [Desulfitobacterium dehalogenans]
MDKGEIMFKEMRNKKRQLKLEEAKELLINGEYGILATNGENGYSYAIPLNYVYINDKIYFHCAIEGHKLDNIALNNKISFCVVGKTRLAPEKFTSKYESVIIFGRAFIADENEKRQALIELINKYSPSYEKQGDEYIDRAIQHTCVVKIETDQITGKANR